MPYWSLLRRRHVDRRSDGDDVEVLHGAFAGHRPSGRANHGLADAGSAGLITGLTQTWCTGVQVRGERWSSFEMRSQHGEGRSSRVGIEQDLRSVALELVSGSGAEVAWFTLGEVGVSAVVGSGSPRYSGCSGSVLSTVQSHTDASWDRSPGSSDRDALRRDLRCDPCREVVLGDDGAVRHRLADQLGGRDTAVGLAARSGNGARSGLQVSNTRQMPHMPDG